MIAIERKKTLLLIAFYFFGEINSVLSQEKHFEVDSNFIELVPTIVGG